MTTTISGTIHTTVMIGPGGYTGPLIIAQTGDIFSYFDTTPGLYVNNPGPSTAIIVNHGNIGTNSGGPGVLVDTPAILINSGTITAGAVYYAGHFTSYAKPGIDVEVAGVVISNTGTIQGGNQDPSFGYSEGGVGVQLFTLDQVLNAGIIIGSNEFSSGGTGILAADTSTNTVSNRGVIEGGAGIEYGISGSDGVDLGAGSFTNAGFVFGGAGGHEYYFSPGGYHNTGGNGGVGADVSSAFNNTGGIIGGAGGFGYLNAGNGGTGASVTYYGDITNTGLIVGGNGDVDISPPEIPLYGGNGGTGLSVNYATVFNSGVIAAGAGGGGVHSGSGGIGVVLHGGTFTNAGTVAGGLASIYGYNRVAGTAMVLSVNSYQSDYRGTLTTYLYASELIVDPGAVFRGTVISQNYVYQFPHPKIQGSGNNRLEVSGTSAKALSGIGTSFVGFKDIGFDTGAAWTIQGDASGLTSGEQIFGFAAGDTIDLSFLHYNASAEISVVTAGTVSILEGGLLTTIDIVGATVGESDFQTTADATGGTDLTRGVQPMAPRMTFMSALFSHAGVPMTATLPPLEQAGGWMEAGNQGRDHTSVGIDLRPYGAVPAVVNPAPHFAGMFAPVTLQTA